MLSPMILIGCGGSGQKAIRYVRDAVERRVRHAGWQKPLPSGWQFIAVDMLDVMGADDSVPPLPSADFHKIAPTFTDYQSLWDASLANNPPGDAHTYAPDGEYVHKGKYLELMGWAPSPLDVKVPLKKGAGQSRAVGRLAGINSLADVIKKPLIEAFSKAGNAVGDMAEITEKLGFPVNPGASASTPMVVVCASMAGGTGAGVALDVVEIVRNTHKDGRFPVLVLFTNDIFQGAAFGAAQGSIAGNSLGMMSELLNAYWGKEQKPNPLFAGSINNPGRGPHATFLIGRQSLSGGDLGDVASVYKSVGESLANWVTDKTVQESAYEYVTTNWEQSANARLGGYPFDVEYQRGAVSSFGAATITTGRERFEIWAVDLLSRAVLESLDNGHLHHNFATAIDKNTPESVIIAELAEKAALLIAHGESEVPIAAGPIQDTSSMKGALSISNFYADRKELEAEKFRIAHDIKQKFPPSTGGNGSEWKQWLTREAQTQRDHSFQRARQFDPAAWGKNVIETTAKSVSMVTAETSLHVSIPALTEARRLLHSKSESMRSESVYQRRKGRSDLDEGLSKAEKVGKNTNIDSQEIQEAIRCIAQGIARDWLSERNDMASDALTHAANYVLHPAEETLRQKAKSVKLALADSNTAKWPTANAGIPIQYQPSTVEFPLEGHDKWVSLLDEICSENKNGITASMLPFQATVFALIAGSPDGTIDPLVKPITETWTPSGAVVAKYTCPADADEISKRTREWARRPGSKFDRVVSEGLRDYLLEFNKYDGKPVGDHKERLVMLRTQLEKAKSQSAPLLRVDDGIHGTIYPGVGGVSEMLVCAQFPFPQGHPAHEITKQIIGTENFKQSSADVSSVLVSSFLANPIHPMAVTSFTEPIADAYNKIAGSAQLNASFWLWRRSRRIDHFVPMPNGSIDSIIRGFAAARLCGCVTADPSQQISVSGNEGPTLFPHPLLTQVYLNDVLAGLIESFSLCMAIVGIEKENAFEPYRRLHELGDERNLFGPDSPLRAWLACEEMPYEQVDKPKATGSNPSERCKSALEYMRKNITHFEEVAAMPLKGKSEETKPQSGKASSKIPTREIVPALIDGYRRVCSEIERVCSEIESEQGTVV